MAIAADGGDSSMLFMPNIVSLPAALPRAATWFRFYLVLSSATSRGHRRLTALFPLSPAFRTRLFPSPDHDV